MLKDTDIIKIKFAIQMINNKVDSEKIGAYLDNHYNIADALAHNFAVYTKSILYSNIHRLLQADINNYEGWNNPFTVVMVDSKRAHNICENYDYPIIQGAGDDIENGTDTLMDADFDDKEISMPELKKDLLTLAHKTSKK